jgi:hypothetical protein
LLHFPGSCNQYQNLPPLLSILIALLSSSFSSTHTSPTMKLTQVFLEIIILLISFLAAQPTTPRGILDRSKKPAAPVSSATPAAPTCRCTVVFGDKSSLTLVTAAGTTNGLTGQATNKKACTTQLLAGTGCSAAVSAESDKQCVKSQACITA